MPNPVHELDRQLRKWTEVRDMLSGEDLDEQTLLDTLEGETDLHEAIGDIDTSLLEDETQLAGLQATITRLETRAARHEKAIKTKRRIILKTMERAGLKTVKSNVGTLTVSPGAQSVVVLRPDLISEKYLKRQEPAIDKIELGKDLCTGLIVHGAALNNAPSKLTIRRS